MQWIVIVAVSIFHGCVLCYEGCSVSYGKRSCQHRMINGVVVICDGHGVETQVPRNLPQDTLHLSLVNFNFSSRPLSNSDFARLTTVQCLSIIRSGLVGIEKDALSQFQSLYELHLECTQINESSQLTFIAHDNDNFRPEFFRLSRSPYLTSIDDDDNSSGSGKSLQSLKALRLDHNSLLRVSAGFFAALKNLEILDLSHNRLVGLPWEMFVHLVGLNQLLLAGNQIQTIPDAPMRPVFFAVKHLTVAGNPLHCNCRLRWLREFYLRDVTDRQSDVDQVYCRGPEYSRIARVPPAADNFRCFSPRDPVVTWTEAGDGRVEVNCSAEADPAPTLTLTLTPTNSGNSRKRVVIPPSENMAELSTSTPQILFEPGLVTCEAVNSEGSGKVVGHVGPEVSKLQ